MIPFALSIINCSLFIILLQFCAKRSRSWRINHLLRSQAPRAILSPPFHRRCQKLHPQRVLLAVHPKNSFMTISKTRWFQSSYQTSLQQHEFTLQQHPIIISSYQDPEPTTRHPPTPPSDWRWWSNWGRRPSIICGCRWCSNGPNAPTRDLHPRSPRDSPKTNASFTSRRRSNSSTDPLSITLWNPTP